MYPPLYILDHKKTEAPFPIATALPNFTSLYFHVLTSFDIG